MKKCTLVLFCLAVTLVDCTCGSAPTTDNRAFGGCASDPDKDAAVWVVESLRESRTQTNLNLDIVVKRDPPSKDKNIANNGLVRLLGVTFFEEDAQLEKARIWLTDTLVGKHVKLEKDPNVKDHRFEMGTYWTRYVWVGEELINAKLIRNGFARYDLRSFNHGSEVGMDRIGLRKGEHEMLLLHPNLYEAAKSRAKQFSKSTSVTGAVKTLLDDFTVSKPVLFWEKANPDESKMLFLSDSHQVIITDGTTIGTKPIMRLAESKIKITIGNGVQMDGKYYFTAKHDKESLELWETDGTEDGTSLIHRFVGTRIEFCSFQGCLWVFSVEAVQTEADLQYESRIRLLNTKTSKLEMVGEVWEPSFRRFYGNLTVWNGYLYAVVDNCLVRFGKEKIIETVKVFEGRSPYILTATEHAILIDTIIGDRIDDREWWATDGTPKGTTVVSEFEAARLKSYPVPRNRIQHDLDVVFVRSAWRGFDLVVTKKSTKESRIVHSIDTYDIVIESSFAPEVYGVIGDRIVASTIQGEFLNERSLVAIKLTED